MERAELVEQRIAGACIPVSCQRFFLRGRYAGYFEVLQILKPGSSEQQQQQQQEGTPASTLADAVLRNLTSIEKYQSQHGQVVLEFSSAKEVSPWLQITR